MNEYLLYVGCGDYLSIHGQRSVEFMKQFPLGSLVQGCDGASLKQENRLKNCIIEAEILNQY